MRIKTFFHVILILILSSLFTLDLFLSPGRPITFDGHIHLVTMGQFAQSMQSGDFPVVWTNTFANYGLPLGIFVHQTTAYLGAFFYLVTNNITTAYNLVVLLGSILTGLTTYWWLRLETTHSRSALLGTLVILLAPYRILNVFVRGALPEFFAGALIPLVFIGIALFLRKKSWLGLPLITCSVFLLAVTHPMMLLITSFLAVLYFAYLVTEQHPKNWWRWQDWWQPVLLVGSATALGLGLAGYYLLPLLLEIKYFTFGSGGTHLASGAFLGIDSFFSSNWPYFGGHPGPRAQFISAGVWESLLVIGTAVMVWLRRKQWRQYSREFFWIGKAAVFIFLLTPLSTPLYQHIPLLSSIQFPFRFLSLYLFIPGILLGLFYDRTKDTLLASLVILLLVATRYPLLFTKNVMALNQETYLSTTANLYTDNLNTVWMSNAQNYPQRTSQVSIVEGEGEIQEQKLKNSSRSFRVLNTEQVRVVDYTFYFPGWTVTANGQNIPIEFQDPSYRGLITYHLPAGDWQVRLTFEDTKIRLLGKFVSATALGIFIFSFGGVWFIQQQKSGVGKRRFLRRK